MSFSGDLEKFRKKVSSDTRHVFRASALELFSAVTFTTPVDKGVLRNNWFATVPSAGSTELPVSGEFSRISGDITGAEVIEQIKRELRKIKLDSTVFFTNNLAYAERIEFDGHSAQAPEGMVRVNALRWENIVDNNVRKVTGLG